MNSNKTRPKFGDVLNYILQNAPKKREGVDGAWLVLLDNLLAPFQQEKNYDEAFKIGLKLGYFSQYTTFLNPAYQKKILEWYEEYLLNNGFYMERGNLCTNAKGEIQVEACLLAKWSPA